MEQNEIYEEINRRAEAIALDLQAIRRDFHQYPELGWTEMRTSAKIAALLQSYGCDEVLGCGSGAAGSDPGRLYRGAKAIVENGHLDDVDYVLGAHMGDSTDQETCMIGVGNGSSLATVKMDVEFHGKSSHAAASTEAGNNAMLAAATAILNLHAIPRHGKAGTGSGKRSQGILRNGSNADAAS